MLQLVVTPPPPPPLPASQRELLEPFLLAGDARPLSPHDIFDLLNIYSKNMSRCLLRYPRRKDAILGQGYSI